MRKSTIFISAVLTTFTLVMLYGVVSAYRGSTTISASAQAGNPATSEPIGDPIATQSIITPEEAAQLAVQVVGNTNLVSAESSTFDGLDAYLITFTNNDVVYVGLDGQILAVQVAPVFVSIAPPARSNNNGGGGGESHDDNDHDDDEHDDDDD